jgi:hypothetical protein
MSDTESPVVGRGLLQDLGDLFVAPTDAFRSLVAKNQFWIPMILTAIVLTACMGIWVGKVDPAAVTRAQLEEMGLWQKIPPGQQAQVLASAGSGFAVKQIAGVVVGPPLAALVIAALFLLIFRLAMDDSVTVRRSIMFRWVLRGVAMGPRVTFRQSLTIVCWGSFVVTLVSFPLMLLTLALKGDWNIPLANALNANLTLALNKDATSKFLYSLASSLDLFSFWMIFLYATGFAVAAKRTLSWALLGITIPWAVYVLIKSGVMSRF